MNSLIKTSVLLVLLIVTSSCSLFKNMKETREQKVQIETTQGTMIVKLYNETPLHRDNFVKLVKEKFYDGILFHRVIADFMVQAGDPDSRNAQPDTRLGSGGVGYTIPAEFKVPVLYHKRGALSAARTGDQVNPTKASSGCQFYIVTGQTHTEEELDRMLTSKMARVRRTEAANENPAYSFSVEARSDYQTIGGTPHLDGDYTVFGEVIKGFEVLDKISDAETNSADRPKEDIQIIRMKLVR